MEKQPLPNDEWAIAQGAPPPPPNRYRVLGPNGEVPDISLENCRSPAEKVGEMIAIFVMGTFLVLAAQKIGDELERQRVNHRQGGAQPQLWAR